MADGAVIPLGEDAIEPMALVLGVAVYGIMANLCYTLVGLELRRRRTDLWPLDSEAMDVPGWHVVSCVLTSLPFWFACVIWIAHR